MVFLVFLDPNIISAAVNGGDIALSALCGILHGFRHNCLLAEVDGWQVDQGIKDAVLDMPEGDFRIRIQKLLVIMKNKNRFVDCLTAEEGNAALVDTAFKTGREAGLDFILSEAAPLHGSPETAGLAHYPLSNFERSRSRWEEGIPISEGAHEAEEFFRIYFRGLVKYAQEIVIIDAILGRKFGDNFQFSLEKTVKWIEEVSIAPSKLKLRIITEDSVRKGLLPLRLKQWTDKIQTEVTFGNPGHERYLFTNQGFAISLGRGCDFFDKDTGRNRDTHLGFVSHEKARQ